MIRKTIAALALCLFTPLFASAQNYPVPASAGEPLVPCTGCLGHNSASEVNEGKLLFPYDVPVVDHVGRFVDSVTVQNTQNDGMRSLRADAVRLRPSRDRIYMRFSSTIAAYTLSQFFTTTLTQPMVEASRAFVISPQNPWRRIGSPLEKVTTPLSYIYPECRNSGWTYGSFDTQAMVTDFDTDDRGYVYLTTIYFGVGIHFDDGRSDRTHLPFVAQFESPFFSPQAIVSLRNGTQYALVVANSHNVKIFDTTTPATPTAIVGGPVGGFTAWSKYEAGSRVAVLNTDGRVRIYTNAGYINGSAAIAEVVPATGKRFRDIAFDDSGNLWVTGSGGMRKLVPAPTAEAYTEVVYPFAAPSFDGYKIHAGAGYVAVGGAEIDAVSQAGYFDVRLFTLTNGTPEPLSTNNYFRKHYFAAPSGHAQPMAGAMSNMTMNGVRLIEQNGLKYLMLHAGGLGDVYELGAVLRPPQLAVTSISPVAGPPAGGTTVTIKGRNFAQGAVVTFGNNTAPATFVDSFTLTTIAPPGTNGSAVDVAVALGAEGATSPTKFAYILNAPSNVTATATSTTNVLVSWPAATGAAQYDITRRNSDGTFTTVGTTPNLSFNDTGLTPNTAYLYRIHSRDTGGNRSAASIGDIATTMQFTNATITAGMTIRAAHILELRQAVNLSRAAAGLSAYTFTSPVSTGATVQRDPLNELRNALYHVTTALGRAAVYTDASLNTKPVKAIHVQEIMEGVR